MAERSQERNIKIHNAESRSADISVSEVTGTFERWQLRGFLGGSMVGAGIGEAIHLIYSRTQQIDSLDNPVVYGAVAGAIAGSAVGWCLGMASFCEDPKPADQS